MLFMPFQVLGIWCRSLISLALLIAGVCLLYEWYEIQSESRGDVAANRDHWAPAGTRPEPGAAPDGPRGRSVQTAVNSRPNDGSTARVVQAQAARASRVRYRETAYLIGGLSLIAWSFGGGRASAILFRRKADAAPRQVKGASHLLDRPDGTKIYAEVLGPDDGIPLILTHGWGLDHEEWCYAKEELSGQYRLIVWDLPGLGHSTGPSNRDWSLEKLAGDLNAVIELAGDRPVILAGHSIGGMIILTYCRLFHETLRSRVAGLVLAHTTYTNPVKTTSMSALYTALQKPVLEPLCHLMIWLSPLVWLLNWLSYLNGSAHRSTERSSFSGRESREQLRFITRYYVQASPAVTACGMLGMFRYNAADILASISVPTLIVTGDKDKTCKPDASVTMAAAIPRSELVQLKSAKHCGLFEYHHQFSGALTRFVSSCGGAKQGGEGMPPTTARDLDETPRMTVFDRP